MVEQGFSNCSLQLHRGIENHFFGEVGDTFLVEMIGLVRAELFTFAPALLGLGGWGAGEKVTEIYQWS